MRPQIEFQRPRDRPTIEKNGMLVTKKHIPGLLQDCEVEIGEVKHRIVHNVSCEHNLRNIPTLIGTLIVTNFKVMFKPNETQPNVKNDAKLKFVGHTRVHDFFRLPLGILSSVESKAAVIEGEKVKHSRLEILSKD